MEEYRNGIILFCVLSYMAACVGIGLWAMKRTKSTHDFFMAGRNLGAVITGVAMFSSIMSGFGFVGGPGFVYTMGISSFWILLATPLGLSIAFYLLAKRLRMIGELRGCVSLPDVAECRYNSKQVRLLVAVAILFGVIGYLAAQIKAMALVLQNILLRNEIPGAESIEVCIAISCAVLVFYCVTGGIIASVYTDLFQGLVMVIAAVLIFFTASSSMEGGFTAMSQTIAADDPEATSPWGTLGVFGCLSWFFVFCLGLSGQPHVITKLMMSKKVEDARFTLPITLAGYTMSALLWISIGYLIRAMVLMGTQAELSGADRAAATFLQDYTHPVLAGLVFAGLFAAIMSTADSFLNIGAAALVHDIPKSLGWKPASNELTRARIATVLLAIGAAVFARLSPMNLIGQLGTFGWGVFASTLVPAIAFGINWKRATPRAAVISISFSILFNLFVVVIQLAGYSIPYKIAGGAIALIVSLTLFVGISLFSKPVPIDSDIETVMEL
jgi:SSS family transporter